MSALDLNEVRIAGSVGNDLELNKLSNGKEYCRFNVATTLSFVNKDGETREMTEWHRMVAFGKVAQHIVNDCQKGTNAYFNGRLQSRFFDDNKGLSKEITEIVILGYQVISGKKTDDVDLDEYMDDVAKKLANNQSDGVPY